MPRYVDLTVAQFEGNGTQPIHGETPKLFRGPVTHGLSAQRGIRNPYDGSLVSAQNEYILITGHTGTHVDAPSHVDHRSRITAELLPLERTQGPAIWFDLSGHIADSGPEITVTVLEDAERATGENVEVGDILLLHTGWSPSPDTRDGAPPQPFVTSESAERLRAWGIGALGVDLPSPEHPDASDLPVHMNFLRPRSIGLEDADYILIYENLTGISGIGAPHRFRFVGTPIPFRGSSGSPVRAYAVTD